MRLLPFDYAIRNLGRSPKRLALVVGGSALVSLLVLGSVGFGRGMERSFAASGLPSNALVLGSGSEESVERSEIPPSTAGVLAASIDGLRTVAGRPAVSAEIHVALPAALADGSTGVSDPTDDAPPPAVFRGFEPEAFLVHPQVRLAEGRWPNRGADEVAVGTAACARLGTTDARVGIGDRILAAGQPFLITGILEAPGTVMHGEIWMRLDRLAQLTQRSTHSCVVAALGDAEFDDVDAFTSMRLDLETVAMRESDYYERLAAFLSPVRALVLATAALIAIGGVLGGINAMYAAFSSRVREVGTLQALGFTRGAIAVSLVIESTVACLAGALLACATGVMLLDGIAIRFTMGSFGIAIDAVAVLAGLLAGLLLGLVGALPAILRCLALPIPSALRS
jgi:putative ABC transport system permease protein